MGGRVSKGKKVKSTTTDSKASPSEPKKTTEQPKSEEVKKVEEVKVVEEKKSEEVAVVAVQTSPPSEEQKDSKLLEEKPVEEPKFIQTGGHVGAFSKLDGGKIMKKVGKNEFHFYSEQLPKYQRVHPFVPTFFGTDIKEDNHYIIIEDLTRHFKTPCILDIKMGTSSVGEDASPEKKAAMEKKDFGTTTHTLGLRITAMKVYSHELNDYESYGKDFGKKVTDATFLDTLKIFFHGRKEISKDLVEAFHERLRAVHDWISDQNELRLYSSSILFIYDGHRESDMKVEMKLIDFAHVHEITDGGKDEGYIKGMNNLVQFMEQLK